MTEFLTAAFALLFAAWVVVASGALQHWWWLATRKETVKEFWAALIGCRMCTGFWLSFAAWPFTDLSWLQVVGLNGVHYAWLVVEGALWVEPEEEDDTSSMAT